MLLRTRNSVFNGKAFAFIGLRLVLMAVILGVILRICLIFNPITDMHGAGFWGMGWIFIAGALNDVFVTTIMLLPLWAFGMSAGTWKFGKPQGYIILGLLAAGWVVLKLFPGVLAEFNRGLHRAMGYVVLYWIATFALRMFIPKMRQKWTQVWIAIITGVYIGVQIFNFIGEWLFWDEFGVRYNFIAVDYLIYTNEVVGNICESYPIGWIIFALVVFTAAIEWIFFRHLIFRCKNMDTGTWRWRITAFYLPAVAISLIAIPLIDKTRTSENTFVNELQTSGAYSFLKAFSSNKLDFNQFYLTNPDEVVEADMQGVLNTPSVPDSVAPAKHNIILITMESMSAAYMEHFGGNKHLTPSLDSLYKHSVAFNRMFAAGNRTVRGLEALTLSRPPAPGESIIKREDNTGYPSIADVLRQQGYDISYIYGGDSYFDNMESFFGGLGYKIVDNGNFTPDEVNFKTVWGICDGDVYSKVIRLADEKSKLGKPFFMHIMTTSNHRPYTYPDGKISIPPSKKCRDGGVMYSDYALGEFIEEAKKQPWFGNTIFVIVADHCASSAGSVDLPLENYHIPAMIYAPAVFEAREVDKTASQTDLMPTLFALMGWKYDTPLYGKNILSDDYAQRAFIATYQDMGYLQNDTLTVLSPGKKARQFVVEPTAENPFALKAVENPTGEALSKTVSLYQKSSSTK